MGMGLIFSGAILDYYSQSLKQDENKQVSNKTKNP